MPVKLLAQVSRNFATFRHPAARWPVTLPRRRTLLRLVPSLRDFRPASRREDRTSVMHTRARIGVGLALGLGLLAAPGPGARGEGPNLAEYFGFRPLEIYKLDPRISNLLIRDLDGD